MAKDKRKTAESTLLTPGPKPEPLVWARLEELVINLLLATMIFGVLCVVEGLIVFALVKEEKPVMFFFGSMFLAFLAIEAIYLGYEFLGLVLQRPWLSSSTQGK